MKIRCSLLTCFALVFALLFATSPAIAHADDTADNGLGEVTELYQKDFLNEDGSYRVYELKPGGSYKLMEDVNGAFQMYYGIGDGRVLTVLELNEHTLTAPASLNQPAVKMDGVFANLSIMNGSIVQESPTAEAVRHDTPFGFLNLDLGSEHSITSNNSVCIASYGAENLSIKSGTYVVNNNTSNSPVLHSGSGDYIYIYDGTFITNGGTDIVYVKPEDSSNPGHIKIMGQCSFNQYPKDATISSESGLSLVCKKYEKNSDGTVTASFVAETTPTDFHELDGYLKDQGTLGNVYFENESDFNAFLEDHEIAEDDIELLFYTVTFEAVGATQQPQSQRVHWGDKAQQPVAPTKKGFYVAGWMAQSEPTFFDFDTRVITSNLKLRAWWERKSRPLAGEENTSGSEQTENESGSKTENGDLAKKAASLISGAPSTKSSLPQTGDVSSFVACVAGAGAALAAMGALRRRK